MKVPGVSEADAGSSELVPKPLPCSENGAVAGASRLMPPLHLPPRRRCKLSARRGLKRFRLLREWARAQDSLNHRDYEAILAPKKEHCEVQRPAAVATQLSTPGPVVAPPPAARRTYARYVLEDGAPNEVVVSRFNVPITRATLQCLRPGAWLNDEVINCYFKLLQDRCDKTKHLPRCWFANSFFWEKLSGGEANANDKYTYAEVRRWTTRAGVDIFLLDYVIIPMNVGGMHWAVGIIDFRARRFRYLDSMLSQPHANLGSFLRRYLADEHASKKQSPLEGVEAWTMPLSDQVPEQQNGYDCGVFACLFADYVSADKPIDFDQEHMQDFRALLAGRIVDLENVWDTA